MLSFFKEQVTDFLHYHLGKLLVYSLHKFIGNHFKIKMDERLWVFHGFFEARSPFFQVWLLALFAERDFRDKNR